MAAVSLNSRDITALYASHLTVSLMNRERGDLVRTCQTQSFPIKTGEGIQIHAFATVPPKAWHLLLISSGASHTWAQDAYWMPPFLERGFAVVYLEPYGHGVVSSPYSASHPETRDTAAMTRALLRAYEGGLLPLYEWNPILRDLPIHELGLSMGGGTIVHAHQLRPQGLKVKIDATKTRTIASVTLVNPRLRLGENYPWALRRLAPIIARVLGPLLRWPPLPPGIQRDHPEGGRILELRRSGERPTRLPAPYAGTVFQHDDTIAAGIRNHPVQLPQPLWVLNGKDTEVDPKTTVELALQISGPGSLIMEAPHHNPFWRAGFADKLAGILRASLTGEASGYAVPLNAESAHNLLHPPPAMDNVPRDG